MIKFPLPCARLCGGKPLKDEALLRGQRENGGIRDAAGGGVGGGGRLGRGDGVGMAQFKPGPAEPCGPLSCLCW